MKRIATTLFVASLMATSMLALPPAAQARVDIGIGISVGIPPPALPVYAQPVIPGPGYIWTPGYWAWDADYGDYYWVPGTWVMPPQIGLLWTPGWWGWSDGFYRWHSGYWGSHVGFYGGVNYGHGYFGNGYSGGYWRGRDFYYNRAVNNVNVTHIRNVYVNKTVINNVHASRVSYNGGHGGLSARPTAQQRTWASQRHVQPTTVQTQQRNVAMRNPAQRFKANQGRPAVFATQRPGNFNGPHAVRASAPANHRVIAAPERARPTTAAANRPADHRMVAAPEHARPATPAPSRGMVQAPHNRTATPRRQPANAAPNRPERERVMAPPRNERQPAAAPRPEMQRAQPEMRREQRPQPNAMRPQPPRNERPAPRHEPQAHGKPAEKRPPPKSSGGH